MPWSRTSRLSALLVCQIAGRSQKEMSVLLLELSSG